MKKSFLALTFSILCACVALCQGSYITTTGTIVMEASALEQYDAPVVFVSGCYDIRQQVWQVSVGLATGVVSATTPIRKEYVLVFTKAQIDAYTGTGTGDTAKAQNALDQAVKAYIQGLNGSSTVTIH